MVEIIKYQAPVKSNPFDGDVAELIAAGEDSAAVYVWPIKEVAKTAKKLRDAANAAGKTATLAEFSEDAEAGTARSVYRLVPRHKRGAAKTEQAETPAETPTEAPAAEATEAPAEGEAEVSGKRRR